MKIAFYIKIKVLKKGYDVILMKYVILILDIICLFLFFILMIDAMLLIKKSTGKRLEEIRNPILKRIRIGTILVILVGILTIIRIIMSGLS